MIFNSVNAIIKKTCSDKTTGWFLVKFGSTHKSSHFETAMAFYHLIAVQINIMLNTDAKIYIYPSLCTHFTLSMWCDPNLDWRKKQWTKNVSGAAVVLRDLFSPATQTPSSVHSWLFHIIISSLAGSRLLRKHAYRLWLGMMACSALPGPLPQSQRSTTLKYLTINCYPFTSQNAGKKLKCDVY